MVAVNPNVGANQGGKGNVVPGGQGSGQSQRFGGGGSRIGSGNYVAGAPQETSTTTWTGAGNFVAGGDSGVEISSEPTEAAPAPSLIAETAAPGTEEKTKQPEGNQASTMQAKSLQMDTETEIRNEEAKASTQITPTPPAPSGYDQAMQAAAEADEAEMAIPGGNELDEFGYGDDEFGPIPEVEEEAEPAHTPAPTASTEQSQPVAEAPAAETIAQTRDEIESKRRNFYASEEDVVQNFGGWGRQISDPAPVIGPEDTSLSSEVFNHIAQQRKKSAKENAAQRTLTGSTVSNKMVTDNNLGFQDVSMYLGDLQYMVRQPTSNVGSYLANQLNRLYGSNLTAEDVVNKILNGSIMQLVNDTSVPIFSQKDPVVGEGDQNIRVLRIHDDTQSIKLHPVAPKLMNADLDGDEMKLEFYTDMLENQMYAADLLVNPRGAVMIDEKFLTPSAAFADEKMLTDEIKRIMRDAPDSIKTNEIVQDAARIARAIKDGKLQLAFNIVYNDSIGHKHGSQMRARNVTSYFATEIYKSNYRFGRIETMDRTDEAAIRYEYLGPALESVQTPEDQVILDFVERCIRGELPNNWHALRNVMNNTLETFEGRNREFRLTAGVGKAIKLSPYAQIGDGDFVINGKNYKYLAESIARLKYSMTMSDRMNLGEKQTFIAQEVRKMIMLKSDGMTPWLPTDPAFRPITGGQRGFLQGEEFMNFVEWFAATSDHYYTMASQADIEVYSDYQTVNRRGKFRSVKPIRSTKEWVDRFVDVYGELKLNTVFGWAQYTSTPGSYVLSMQNILAKYGEWTINDFCQKNKLNPQSIAQVNLYKSNMPGNCNRRQGEKSNPVYDIVYCMAEKRSEDASIYNDNLNEACKELFKANKKGKSVMGKLREALKHPDQEADTINAATRVLSLLHPDAFEYFGLESPDAFVKSPLGQKLIGAKNANVLLDIRNQALIQYRMSNLQKAWESSQRQESSNSTKETLDANVVREIEMLASSSNVWRIIVADWYENGALWRQMKAEARNALQNGYNKKAGWHQTPTGSVISSTLWNKDLPGERLIDFLMSDGFLFASPKVKKQKVDANGNQVFDDNGNPVTEVTNKRNWIGKDAILADMVSFYTGITTRPWEINYQLDHSPAGIWGRNRYGDRSGYNQTMEYIKQIKKDAPGVLNRKTFENMQKDVESCRKYGDKIFDFMHDRGSRWSSRCYIGSDTYATALAQASMNKDYDDTEKGSQQDCIKAIHQACEYARNGVLLSDFELLDDFATGRCNIDTIRRNPEILVYILSNPDLAITVYDETGTYELSRATLIGDTMDGNAVWDFLQEHPRVAMAFRQHRAVVGENGSIYQSSVRNFRSAMAEWSSPLTKLDTVRDEIRIRMFNHPGFGAVVAGMTGIDNSSTARTTAYRVSETVDNIVDAMIQSFVNGGDYSSMIGDYAIPESGPARKEHDRQLSHLIEYFGEAQRIITSMGYTVNDVKRFIRDRDRIPEENEKLRKEKKEKAQEYDDRPFDPQPLKFLLVDENGQVIANNISFMQDVEQKFSGAKTATSTQINGDETRKLGAIGHYNSIVNPPCDAAPVEVSINDILEDPDHYLGWAIAKPKDDGTFTDDDVLSRDRLDQMNLYPNETIMLFDPSTCMSEGHVCQHHLVSDQSLNVDRTQQIPGSALLTVMQRADGTEKNNLKFVKTGVDSSDAIAKIDLWSFFDTTDSNSWYRKWHSDIEDAFKSGNMQAARIKYAEYLMEVQASMGYNDLTFGQYVNVAQQLIRGNKDDGLQILSIHQIARVINYAIANSGQTRFSSEKEFKAFVDQAMRNYNANQNFDESRVVDRLKVASAASGNLLTGTKILNASSMERNWQLINEKYSTVWMSANDRLRTMEAIGGEAGKNIADSARAKIKQKKPWEREKLGSRLVVDSPWDSAIPIPQGPASAVELRFKNMGRTDEDKAKIIRMAEKLILDAQMYGTTVIIPRKNNEFIDEWLASAHKDIWVNAVHPIVDRQAYYQMQNGGNIVIPFFDIALNGDDSADPTFNVGMFYTPDDSLTYMVQTSQMEIGDGEYKATEHFADRVHFEKSGQYRMDKGTLFPNLLTSDFDKWNRFQIEIVPFSDVSDRALTIPDEVKAQGADAIMKYLPNMDLGVHVHGTSYERIRTDFLAKLDYLGRRIQANQGDTEAWMYGVQPGDLIGFAKLVYDDHKGHTEEWWSPITPYDVAEGKGAPYQFNIENLEIDDKTGQLILDWWWEGGLRGEVAKFLEGYNEANKGMIDGVPIQDATLADGSMVDVFAHTASFATRRIGSLRNDTCRTLMWKARTEPFGYNFASHPDSFPNKGDQDIKRALLTGEATYDNWVNWMNGRSADGNRQHKKPRFSSDPGLNVWLTEQVQNALNCGVDPTFMLASQFYTDADPEAEIADIIEGQNPISGHIHFPFDIMFRQTDTDYDYFLKWMNMMNPKLCPPSMNAEYNGEFFMTTGEDHSLQTMVPHVSDTGKEYDVPEYLFISQGFFDEHYSGWSRPSIAGAHKSVSALTLSANLRHKSSSYDLKNEIQWALGDIMNLGGKDSTSLFLDPNWGVTE